MHKAAASQGGALDRMVISDRTQNVEKPRTARLRLRTQRVRKQHIDRDEEESEQDYSYWSGNAVAAAIY
jgi:hypothetical protein